MMDVTPRSDAPVASLTCAAVLEPSFSESKTPVRELEPLLAEEVAEGRREMAGDCEPSAALVRRYAGSGSLGGAALVVDGQVAGYGYAVLEEPRGIIGDLYLRPHMREAG